MNTSGGLPKRIPVPAWPLLLVALSLTGALWHAQRLERSNALEVRHAAETLAERVERWTRQAVGRYEYGLRGARGAIVAAGGPDIDAEAFGRYTATRDLDREFPGTRGFGFIRRVEAADAAAYIDRQRRQGRPDFDIRQLSVHDRERYVIEFVEPVARNREAIGLDIASEDRRRQAAQRALETGLPTLSAPITLVQASARFDDAFVLLLPVYAASGGAGTDKEAFGWTYAPLLIDEVLAGAEWLGEGFELSLSDVSDSQHARPFLGHVGGDPDRSGIHPLEVRREFSIHGRVWRAQLAPTRALVEAMHLRRPKVEALLIAAGGLLLALLLHYRLRHRQQRRQLLRQRLLLAAIVEGADRAIVGVTLDGRIQGWNPAAERLLGHCAERVLWRPLASLLAIDPARLRTLMESIPGQDGVPVLRVRHAKGHSIEVQVDRSPIFDERGAPAGQALEMRDITRQRAVEDTFKALMRLGSTSLGNAFVERATESLCGLLQADYVFIARLEAVDGLTHIRVESAWGRNGPRERWSSALRGTPCEVLYDPEVRRVGDVVLEDGTVMVPRDAEARFERLHDSGLQAFIGFPLRAESGALLGHIAAFFGHEIRAAGQAALHEVGALFAHRLEAELDRIDIEAERDHAMAELRAFNLDLESQVAARTEQVRRVSVLHKAVLDNAGHAVIASNTEGRITVFNPSAERMLGYRAEEVMGGLWSRFHVASEMQARAEQLAAELGEQIAPGFECFFAGARRGRKDENEWTYVRKDGSRFPVLLTVSPLLDEGGTIVGYVGLAADLSERKRLEQAVATERDRLHTIVDLAPSAILIVSADGRIESTNARVENVFGYARHELEGQPLDLLLDPGQRSAHVAQRTRYLSGGDDGWLMSGRTVSARHRDGSTVPVEVRLSRFRDGDSTKVIAIATDRSEHQLLADSEQRWRRMANHLPQLVWTCEPDGGCDYLSRQWVDYTGVAEAAQHGCAWLEQVHPEDRESLIARWQDTVRAQGELRVEFRLRRHDGMYRWFDTRALPLFDAQKRLLKWVGSNTDIEERRLVEQRLQDLNSHLEQRIDERTQALESARRDLRNILDALPSMVGYWDRELRNRFANRAYADWFGVDPATIPGLHMSCVIGPTLFARNAERAAAALRGEPQCFEREIRAADGSLRHAQTQYLPDLIAGEVRGFYALVHDITDVRRAQAEAEAASAAKSTFLANMSHEIRTPLNAVQGMLQLLAHSLDPAARTLYLQKADLAARTLLAILNDVLDYSKIEAGKLELDEQPFDLDALLREVGTLMAASRGDKPLEIGLSIGPDLPHRLCGDALRLKQILINLAGNAVKFTPSGDIEIGVHRIAGGERWARLRFSVRDTGIGMDPAQCEHLFQGFHQAEASISRRFGGTGLGLAISQRLAQMMDSRIEVQSHPGQGSRFWFDVTLALDTAETADASPPPRRQAGAHRRILLVEPHEGARARIAGLLRGFGWTVTAVGTCTQAAVPDPDADRPFDVIFIDWPRSAETCGGRLVTLQERASIPVIGLAGNLQLAHPGAAPGSVLCPVAVLTKPLTASMLFDAVMDLDRPPASAASPALGGRRLAGRRILVIEDNVTNQLVAQALLVSEGARVSLAGHGGAGLSAIEQARQPFDAVLMDIQMPDMDGFETTRRLRAMSLSWRPLVIATTANAMQSDRDDCLRAGMDDHIAKPFDLDHLVDCLRRHWGEAATTMSASAPDPGAAGRVDRRGAITRLGADAAIYDKVLRSALPDFPGLLATVSDTAIPCAERRRAAHTLKGLAATLGAEDLRIAALASESALEADAEPDLDSLRAVFGSTLDQLHTLLPPARAVPVTPLDLPAALHGLVRQLQGADGAALAASAALARQAGNADLPGAELILLDREVQALDFVAAAARCRELLERCTAEETR